MMHEHIMVHHCVKPIFEVYGIDGVEECPHPETGWSSSA